MAQLKEILETERKRVEEGVLTPSIFSQKGRFTAPMNGVPGSAAAM